MAQVTTEVLFAVFASISLPVMVKELTKVCPELRKVLKFPVTKISPLCPGVSAVKFRVVGVALTMDANEERMLTPETVLPPSFLYVTLYTTVSPSIYPVKGSRLAVMLRSPKPGMVVAILELLLTRVDSFPENVTVPIKKSWSPVRGILPNVPVIVYEILCPALREIPVQDRLEMFPV
jgi:hypothetical protein